MKLRCVPLIRWFWPGLVLAAPGLVWSVDFEIWTGPDGTLLLQGSMNQRTRDALVQAAQTSLGPDRRMVDYIRVDASSASAPWLGSVAQVIPEIIQVKGNLHLEIDDNGKITLAGILEDEGDRERIQTSLRARFKEQDLLIGGLQFQGDIQRERNLTSKLVEMTGGKTGIEGLTELLGSLAVYFDSASVQLGDSEKEKLEVLATALIRYATELGEATVVIQGFTDGKGSEEANEWYRETRCKSVFDFLLQEGVPERTLAIAEKEGVAARPTVVAEGDATEESPEETNPRRVAFRIDNLDRRPLALNAEVEEDEGTAPLGNVESSEDLGAVPGPDLEEAPAPQAVVENVDPIGSAGEETDDPTVAAEVTALDRLLADSFIEFGAGSTWLNRAGRQRLESVAEAMLGAGGEDGETWKLEIIGTSDSRGDPEVNAWLRKNRCKSVVNQLVALGVPTDRLVVATEVEQAPRARLVGEPLRAQDTESRRVTFRILKSEP
ncbi:MAG TPA: OmpA family protein [Verrucomicrobiales bacterium]|nr:OmpA family protein [Verrucomicrobiales bacterium]